MFSDYTTRRLYEFLHILKTEYINKDRTMNPIIQQFIRQIKEEIRKRNKETVSDRRIIHDYGIDGYILRVECPEYVKTKFDAEEWFHENEELFYYPSPYDCTGQLFTSWHSLFNVNGKWICYYGISCDV